MEKNKPRMKWQIMSPLPNGAIWASFSPNREERRRRHKLRSWFTRTPLLLNKIRRVAKNNKQQNVVWKKIMKIIRKEVLSQ